MNEKHIPYVLAVLEEGSFTAAARKLYISQPSLSQMIKAEEMSLGAPIFDRSTEPVTLTPAGQLYIEAAKAVTDISDNLARQIKDLSNEESGCLKLGISVQRCIEILPKIYPIFRELFPHVDLILYERGSADLERSVLNGDVDIALLTTSPICVDLIYTLIQIENLTLLVNRQCALSGRVSPGTPIDISAASGEQFVLIRRGHSVRSIFDSLCAARVINPAIALETVSIEVAKNIVAAAPVVTPCPDVYADTSNSERSPYYAYPILGVENPRHFYACYRKNIYLTGYMRGFLDILHDLAKES